jgi:hypothetical protein
MTKLKILPKMLPKLKYAVLCVSIFPGSGGREHLDHGVVQAHADGPEQAEERVGGHDDGHRRLPRREEDEGVYEPDQASEEPGPEENADQVSPVDYRGVTTRITPLRYMSDEM